MATGLVNPYAVAGENTDYRDAVLVDNPLGLWMLDEPFGNNVATNQGSVSGGDGAYYGNMQLASSRGLRKVFNIDVAGASYANSNNSLGFHNGSVSVPFNSSFVSNMATNYSSNTWEWVTRIDHTHTGNNYQWMISRQASGGPNYGAFISTNKERRTQRLYKQTTGTFPLANVYGPSNTFGLATDEHHVLVWGGYPGYMRWYINGYPAIQFGFGNYLSQKPPTTESMIFGSYYVNGGASYSLKGAMGGVAYYDYALSQAQITAHYQALLT
jgi:hypothetical protein